MANGTITKIIEATSARTVCEFKFDQYSQPYNLPDKIFGEIQCIGNETNKDRIAEQINSLLDKKVSVTIIPSADGYPSIFIDKV